MLGQRRLQISVGRQLAERSGGETIGPGLGLADFQEARLMLVMIGQLILPTIKIIV